MKAGNVLLFSSICDVFVYVNIFMFWLSQYADCGVLKFMDQDRLNDDWQDNQKSVCDETYH